MIIFESNKDVDVEVDVDELTENSKGKAL